MPSQAIMEAGVSRGFRAAFGRDPDVAASAPGRVILLGEHTDYNDGFVLPIALPQQTTVSIGLAIRSSRASAPR